MKNYKTIPILILALMMQMNAGAVNIGGKDIHIPNAPDKAPACGTDGTEAIQNKDGTLRIRMNPDSTNTFVTIACQGYTFDSIRERDFDNIYNLLVGPQMDYYNNKDGAAVFAISKSHATLETILGNTSATVEELKKAIAEISDSQKQEQANEALENFEKAQAHLRSIGYNAEGKIDLAQGNVERIAKIIEAIKKARVQSYFDSSIKKRKAGDPGHIFLIRKNDELEGFIIFGNAETQFGGLANEAAMVLKPNQNSNSSKTHHRAPLIFSIFAKYWGPIIQQWYNTQFVMATTSIENPAAKIMHQYFSPILGRKLIESSNLETAQTQILKNNDEVMLVKTAMQSNNSDEEMMLQHLPRYLIEFKIDAQLSSDQIIDFLKNNIKIEGNTVHIGQVKIDVTTSAPVLFTDNNAPLAILMFGRLGVKYVSYIAYKNLGYFDKIASNFHSAE